MVLDAFASRLRRRTHRRAYRAMVKKWHEDGGDYGFRFDYDLSPASRVLDLGGYEGQWASDLYSRYRCRIAIFEPVSAFAARIAARFRRNEDIEVFQYGLGAVSRAATIHLRGAGSSTYRKDSAAEAIRIVAVEEWLRENGVSSVQLMKVNIEGGEFELLERLIETGSVELIDDIQVQFHNVEADSARRMESIQRSLENTHTPTYQYRFVWENWTRKSIHAKPKSR